MEAKDTVMSAEEAMLAMLAIPEEAFQLIAQKMGKDASRVGAALYANNTRQAEISFKSGVQEGRREVVEWIGNLHLLVGDSPPKRGEGYVYLGDYILRYGKTFEPQVGFYRLFDSSEWEAKLKEWRIE